MLYKNNTCAHVAEATEHTAGQGVSESVPILDQPKTNLNVANTRLLEVAKADPPTAQGKRQWSKILKTIHKSVHIFEYCLKWKKEANLNNFLYNLS